MSKRKTTEEFINEAKIIHGDKYDYSKVVYLGNKNKVEIICSIHGNFLQTPNSHLSKAQGCSSCAGVQISTIENFIIKANKKHNNKYLYDKSIYKNSKSKIILKIYLVFIFILNLKNQQNGFTNLQIGT